MRRLSGNRLTYATPCEEVDFNGNSAIEKQFLMPRIIPENFIEKRIEYHKLRLYGRICFVIGFLIVAFRADINSHACEFGVSCHADFFHCEAFFLKAHACLSELAWLYFPHHQKEKGYALRF